MQVTIDIEPKTYSLLKKIEEKGMSLDDVLNDAINDSETDTRSSPNDLSLEERIKRFREWVNMKRNIQAEPLSDEALSRESIYEGR